jgi:hypothetical protein
MELLKKPDYVSNVSSVNVAFCLNGRVNVTLCLAKTRNVAIVIACNRVDTPAASMRRPAFAPLRSGEPAFACYGVVDSPSLGRDAVDGVAIMTPARKNVSAADNRQKGQKACSINA